jgi:uncharacterized protein (DUF736 family)
LPECWKSPFCSWLGHARATRPLEGGSDRKPIACLQWRGPAFFPDSCAVSSRTLRSKKAGPRHPALRYGRTRCRSIEPPVIDRHRGCDGRGLDTARRFDMATIGTFKKAGNEIQGEIVTLSVQAKNVRIVPEASRTNDNAPSHRVYVSRAEIGAGWTKRSNEGREYISVKLDDPSFSAPIYANLFADEGGEGYTLIWSRSRKPSGE